MKKERAIIIKDPRLRKVRNELRTLLKLWIADIRSALLEEDSIESQKKLSELYLIDIRSICTCLYCGCSDKDMIYIPDMKQWLCLECNSERVYYKNLRDELQADISMEDIREFLDRLMGDEGIGLTRFGSKCHGYTYSKKILDKMGIDKETQDKFLELCKYYGGYCDCEILFNAKSRLLE